jgi:pilus assembly protein FimV
MKRTLLSTLVITSTLGFNANVFALGMGELELKSTLNQPLQAEIELTNIDDLTEWEIKPSLASDGDFDRAGVEKIFFLSDIDFEIKGNRIVLSSDKSVTEPFLNFLVQVNWPSGRVLREYTLLLDPPVFDEQVQPLAAQDFSKRVETQTVVAAEVQPGNRWEDEAAAPGTYKVQPDDTLWEIAVNTRPSRQVSPQQMMLAIQDSNPGAFIGGNINRLKTHQVLRIPNKQQMAARNDSQAVNEVMRQNRELQSAGAQIDATANAAQSNKAEQLNEGGELKLLSKQNQIAESAGASGDVESNAAGIGRQQEGLQNDLAIALETLDTNTLENNDLKERLASLEEQIATLQRLVSLKDDQLASIQTLDIQKEAQLAERESTSTEVASVDDTTSVAVENVESGAETLVESIAAEGEAAEDFNYAGDADPVAEPVVLDNVVTESEIDPALAANQIQQQTEDRYKPKGMVAEIMAEPALMGGIAGGMALLLALIGLGVKKRLAAKEEEIVDPELAGFDENYEFGEGELEDSSLDDFEFDEDDSAITSDDELNDDLLEGIGGSEDDEIDAEVETTETVAQTADIVGEAEIYIAYGRFDQAADLLKNSIQQEPSRIDLRIKLLEVYLETDDSSSFAEAELELNSIGDIEANEKALVMRNRLSSPISGEDAVPTVDDLMLDDADIGIDMEGLADSDDEFSDGIDFEAALDLTDSDNPDADVIDFASSLDALDAEDDLGLDFNLDDVPVLEADLEIDALDELDNIPTLDSADDLATLNEVITLDSVDDLESLDDLLALDGVSILDEVPTLDSVDDIESLDDLLALDEVSILDEVPTLDSVDDLEPLDDLLALDEVPTLDSVDDLESLDDLLALDEVPTLDEVPDLDIDLDGNFDLSELSDIDGDVQEEGSDSSVIDLASLVADDSSEDIAALESLLDSDDIGDLPGLDFDLDGTGFEGDTLDDDLQALEAELNDLTAVDVNVAKELPLESDAIVLDDDNASLEESAEDFAGFESNSEFDLNELEDLPDFTAETAEADVATENAAKADNQEIDLDQLAAADDEFDFLAGTDECATKLDLARAYLDMEDSEGAKELLQEVVSEGSDQQKHDARALMDSIG